MAIVEENPPVYTLGDAVIEQMIDVCKERENQGQERDLIVDRSTVDDIIARSWEEEQKRLSQSESAFLRSRVFEHGKVSVNIQFFSSEIHAQETDSVVDNECDFMSDEAVNGDEESDDNDQEEKAFELYRETTPGFGSTQLHQMEQLEVRNKLPLRWSAFLMFRTHNWMTIQWHMHQGKM